MSKQRSRPMSLEQQVSAVYGGSEAGLSPPRSGDSRVAKSPIGAAWPPQPKLTRRVCRCADCPPRRAVLLKSGAADE